MMRTALTRRVFLALALVASASAGQTDTVSLDENLVACFADLHVTSDKNNQHQRAGVEQSVRDVLALNPRPANVLF